MEGTKLYILAGSHTDSVSAAADHLIAKLDSLLDGGKIAVTAENVKTDYASDVYKTKQVILNGADIKEYTVVYSNNDKISLKLADLLCDVVEEVCGRRLNLVSDNRAYSGSKEIIIGYSKRLSGVASAVDNHINKLNENEFLLIGEGDFVYAGGKQDDNVAVVSAVNRLINQLLGVTDPERAEITLGSNAGSAVVGSKYSIMTYNDGDNSYQNIADRMTIVKEYMPDIICFQETQTPHAQRYKNSLQIYDYVLYDNDGTTYNSQPIFWKRDKFELVDSGIKWLSDTPDKRSKFADSEYYRSMTYAILKDKATGEQFVVVNTHLDFAKINAKQTEKLLELSAGFRDMPMLCLGDFNMRDTDKGYQNMYNECFMDSGRYLEKKDTATIDFCFIDITKIVATNYKVISDHELSKTASDHYPVYTEFVTGLK
jgi:endonuclease/exonuclease/phosphatase family metal-dependent hydrolase